MGSAFTMVLQGGQECLGGHNHWCVLLVESLAIIYGSLTPAIASYCVFFHDWGDHEHVFSGVSFSVLLDSDAFSCVFTTRRYDDGPQGIRQHFLSYLQQNVRWFSLNRL